MPSVTAPDSDTAKDVGNGIEIPGPMLIAGDTLGEILNSFEERVGVRIVPYDGSDPDLPFINGEPPKYFWYQNSPHRIFGGKDGIVDIHIFRSEKTICPKQDLTFALLNDDEISIGPPSC